MHKVNGFGCNIEHTRNKSIWTWNTKSYFSLLLLVSQEHTHLPSYLQGISSEWRSQPFILGFYSDFKLTPSQVFVILERHAVSVQTLSEGVDICYKAHYIFNLQYQHHCRNVWDFIESCIYKQSGMKNLSSSIRSFRAFMKNAASP